MYTGCKDTKMGGPAIYTYAHMPIHTCVCIYVCVYICVYTYPLRHAYLCMHKYTHNKKEVSCFQPPPQKKWNRNNKQWKKLFRCWILKIKLVDEWEGTYCSQGLSRTHTFISQFIPFLQEYSSLIKYSGFVGQWVVFTLAFECFNFRLPTGYSKQTIKTAISLNRLGTSEFLYLTLRIVHLVT